MERQFGHERFWTEYIDDRAAGFAGLCLHRERFSKSVIVARVVFWDASGQFSVETFDGDVPLEIMEGVIAEAKERVRVR